MAKATPDERQTRHTRIMQAIRQYPLTTQPEIQMALKEFYGINVSLETLRRDLEHLNVAPNKQTGQYEILDFQVTRDNYYDDLQNWLRSCVHDVVVTKQGNIVFIDTDMGLAARGELVIAGIRWEEMKKNRRVDRIAGVTSSLDQVQVFFTEGKRGKKFCEKLKGLWGRPSSFDWESEAEDEAFFNEVDNLEDDD